MPIALRFHNICGIIYLIHAERRIKDMPREATSKELSLFKTIRILSIRNVTGNAYNAVGCYEEIMHIDNEFIQIKCEISNEDIQAIC